MADDLLTLEDGSGNLLLEDGDDLLLESSTPPLPGETFWDVELAADYVDAVCSMHGVTISAGRPDGEGRFTAAEAAMTLDNRDGTWAQYDDQGRLVDWLPGRELLVWAVIDDEPWWLFSGEITAWRELPDGTVEVEAADAFSKLNQGIGRWQPGVEGDTPTERLEAICALVDYPGATRFDDGDVNLYALWSERTVLEEMQQAAMSDGGVLYVDADGTLLYRDRTFTGGRDDQTAVPVLSDNICVADAVVWDLTLVSDDRILTNVADLTNVATVPVTVHAENVGSIARYGKHTVGGTRTEDQWMIEEQGQALAAFLVGRDAEAYARVESATLHLPDPNQDLWLLGIDRRLGDSVQLLHEYPAAGGGTGLLDLYLVVETIGHDITPDTWTMTLGTTRAVGNRVNERWDRSAYDWDQVHDSNVWGY